MNKIGFNLTKINTLQFAIIEDAFSADIDKFKIETNLGYGVDSKNDSILSLVKIQFKHKDNPFLIIEISCEFDMATDF